MSGSFGTLTIGDNDAADLTAGGIADIGMNGIGVDDMVEGLRGTTAGQLRYDNSFGQVSIAISAGTSAAVAAVPHTANGRSPEHGNQTCHQSSQNYHDQGYCDRAQQGESPW